MNVHFTHVVNFIFTEERSAYIFISDTWSGVSSGVRLPAHWSIDTFIINTLMSGHSRSNSPHQIKLLGLRGPCRVPGLPSLGKYQRNSSVFEKDTPLLFRTMGGKWSLWVKVQCVVYYDGMLCALHIWHLMDIQIDPFIHLIVIRSSNIVRRFIIIKCTCLLLWQKYSEFK